MKNDNYTKYSPKKLYQLSCEKIGTILSVFNKQETNGNFSLAENESYDNLLAHTEELLEAHKQDEEGSYKTTIIAIIEWLVHALNEDYILENHSDSFPSIEYVIHKGFEVLHCLMHRDLRRKQLSWTENQIVQEFVSLASQYPNPCHPRQDYSSSTRRSS